MTDCAWMSVAAGNPDIMIDLRCDVTFLERDNAPRKAYVAASDASVRGAPIPEGFPRCADRGRHLVESRYLGRFLPERPPCAGPAGGGGGQAILAAPLPDRVMGSRMQANMRNNPMQEAKV